MTTLERRVDGLDKGPDSLSLSIESSLSSSLLSSEPIIRSGLSTTPLPVVMVFPRCMANKFLLEVRGSIMGQDLRCANLHNKSPSVLQTTISPVSELVIKLLISSTAITSVVVPPGCGSNCFNNGTA